MTGDTEDVSRAFADPGLSLVLRFHLTCHTWLVSSVQVDLPQGLCTPPSRWGGRFSTIEHSLDAPASQRCRSRGLG